MTTDTLFIGGPLDGQRKAVDDRMDEVKVHRHADFDSYRASCAIPTESYRRQSWTDGEHRVCSAFVHEAANPLELLLAGYRPGVAIQAELDYSPHPNPMVSETRLIAVAVDREAAAKEIHKWHYAAPRSGRAIILLSP